MEFRMHDSGLHHCNPREHWHIAFINTVSGNKEGFTKRQIKGAEAAQTPHAMPGCPSMKDFKWVLCGDQIKDCPITAQDAETAFKIWGKNIAVLKGKTTCSKPNPVMKDSVKVPAKLLNLHKEVFLTADIFFMNKTQFFLMMSWKSCFTAVNHLMNRTVPEIFKAFKEICTCHLHCGFHITEVHVDGEFEPLKPLIESLPGGPMVNLASSSEHVPEMEQWIWVVKE